MLLRITHSLVLTLGAAAGMAAIPATAQCGGGQFDDYPRQYDYGYGHYDGHVTPGRSTIVYPRTTYNDVPGRRTSRRIVYGGFSHIDDLAITMEEQANALCLELYYNYQHNPGFRQTYREAYEILTTAKFIHGLEHSGNRAKIRMAVRELDGLFHHVEDDVAYWRGHHYRHIGHGGLTTKLEDLEETLHHFMDDIGARRP